MNCEQRGVRKDGLIGSTRVMGVTRGARVRGGCDQGRVSAVTVCVCMERSRKGETHAKKNGHSQFVRHFKSLDEYVLVNCYNRG
jgi:hypothetical protein